MSVKFKFEGARDLERALGELKRGTAKGVTRRVLKRVLQPVADSAEASGPFKVAVTSKLSPKQRRDAKSDFARTVVSMYVGPIDEEGHGAPHAHLLEFGTGPRFQDDGRFTGAIDPPRPFMRPAWDLHSGDMLEVLGRELWAEIEKTVARAERRAAKAAGRA